MVKTLALPLHFLNEKKGIDFDIYVWAGGKPILYCRADDLKLADRIVKLKSKKKLEHFLVKEEHYSNFIRHMSDGLEAAFQLDESKTLKEQAEDIYYQQRGLLIVLSADPSSKEYYSILRSTCSPFYEFFANTADALHFFYQCDFSDQESDLWLTHSLRVAALSSKLIHETKADEAGKPVYDIIMGAFLHDIGFLTSPWDINVEKKARGSSYFIHPQEGVKAMDFPHVNSWVRAVILKHEEHVDGSGFPGGLSENDFDPIIQCVGAANAFDRFYTLQNKGFDGALKQLLIDKMGAYPLSTLQSLQGIIKKII